MTLPDERRRAIMQVKSFLMRLSSPRATPDVSRAIQEEAARLLKHYPVNQNELNKLGD